MAALKRVRLQQRVCENHHPVDGDEFLEVRQRLRVLRLALGGGEILTKLQGCEPVSADAVEDAKAVRYLAEDLERLVDDFITEDRKRFPACSSPGVA